MGANTIMITCKELSSLDGSDISAMLNITCITQNYISQWTSPTCRSYISLRLDPTPSCCGSITIAHFKSHFVRGQDKENNKLRALAGMHIVRKVSAHRSRLVLGIFSIRPRNLLRVLKYSHPISICTTKLVGSTIINGDFDVNIGNDKMYEHILDML